MSLETITQTVKAVAQRLKPQVKIVAHNLQPNLTRPYSRVDLDGLAMSDTIGALAKLFGWAALLSLLPPDNSPPILRSDYLHLGIALESLGIVLQNGIYDNVRRLYEIKARHSPWNTTYVQQ